MVRYNIYAGVFNLEYLGSVECNNEDEALDIAYHAAIEDYEGYAGSHGIPSWEDIMEEICEYYPSLSEVEQESMAIERWNETVEDWIQYKVVPTATDTDIFEEDIFNFYS